jgi:hypothetical protein
MRLDTRWSRGTLIVLAVALTAASLVSPAAAGHGRRYKGHGAQGGPGSVRHIAGAPAPRHVYYVSHGSSAAPAIAGFIGGLVLGNVLAHAAPPPQAYCPPVAADYYYDPYCHERFSSLDAYGGHLDYRRHPSRVRVIDGNSGRCVGERYWQDGRWCEGGGDDGQGREWNR